MTDVDPDRIREWIDDDLVEAVEPMTDESAEFNYTIQMSNMILHVIRRRPDGPVHIGQEIEYDEEFRDRIRAMDEADRNDLVARVRETLSSLPVIYGFRGTTGDNVRFVDMKRVFLEYRIYPDGLSQHELMSGLVGVWKAMNYLDTLPQLADSVEK
ncbi:DUF2299 family protein [Natrinema gelatinilyticum]|uniref:DUF2299 family protein n=1 Tax=Natrinema gelatinilyticum TaxID=2961571 RepID=UPI0020C2AEF2|nr:DUF2299 family protein [Natrinema gelatinilyticum]